MSEWKVICRVEDIPVLGSRRVARANGHGRGGVPQRRGPGVRVARPLPAQGRPAVAGHRVRHQRGLPAAQLDHRPAGRLRDSAPDEGCTPKFACKVEAGQVSAGRGGAGHAGAGHASGRPQGRQHEARPDVTAHCDSPLHGDRLRAERLRSLTEGNTLHLPLLRRGLRRDHRVARASRSPACAATRITRPTSAGCAPRARRCTSPPRAPVTRQTRLLHPMRREHRGEAPQRVSWDEALDFAAETLRRRSSASTAPTPSASTSRASC